MNAEPTAADWWLSGWTRKRDEYHPSNTDPLLLCRVHGRQESALMRRSWGRFVIEVMALEWVMKKEPTRGE
jgi:hypothetical protein